jgi:hypothetical protein
VARVPWSKLEAGGSGSAAKSSGPVRVLSGQTLAATAGEDLEVALEPLSGAVIALPAPGAR